MLSGVVGNCQVLVPVQSLDRYKHFGAFSLVWVPPVDLYEHLHSDVVIVQISFVKGIVRGTALLCTNLEDSADIRPISKDLIGKPWPAAHSDVQTSFVHRSRDAKKDRG